MKRDEFIKQNIAGKVLDIGCEAGELHKIIFNENVFGLDIKPEKYKNNVVKCDAEIISFKNDSFNAIVAGEIIEHIRNPENMLVETKRILKENGVIIISTPNKKSWVNRLFKSSFHKSHISLFDIKSILTTVEKYFFIEKFFLLPYDEITSWGSKHKNLFWIRKLVHYFIPKSLQENIIILARKKTPINWQ